MNRKDIYKILVKIEETNSIDFSNKKEHRFYKIYNGLLFVETFPFSKSHGSILRLTNKGKELIKYE